MSEPFIGEIKLWSGTFEPRGWAFCDGRMISIMDNQALYSILGNRYGGDGRQTFALPDFRGRVPMGVGIAPGLTPRYLGSRIGYEAVSLTLNQMPEHIHNITTTSELNSLDITIKGYDGKPDSNNLEGNVLAQTANGTGSKASIYPAYSTEAPNKNMDPAMVEVSGDITVTAEVQPSGGSLPHNNIQPSQVVNYIIALDGLYPSRS